jgi:hypothetical protein
MQWKLPPLPCLAWSSICSFPFPLCFAFFCATFDLEQFAVRSRVMKPYYLALPCFFPSSSFLQCMWLRVFHKIDEGAASKSFLFRTLEDLLGTGIYGIRNASDEAQMILCAHS